MKESKELLIEVRGLKKYFPVYAGIFRKKVGDIKAVDDIDFSIPYGSVLGMVGESGSGKSTAARAAIRLIEPTAGEIYFEGEDLRVVKPRDLKRFRRHVQIVFQDPYASLNPRKAVGDSIGEPLLYHGVAENAQEREDRVVEMLEKVGLSSDVMRRYPHELSGGQQQRVCIARAIILNPKLVICDEAVSALDVSVQAQILNLLLDLREQFGLSYLFVSHDLSVVRYIADEVVVMHQGKIVERGDSEQIFNDPHDPYTQKLLAAIPKILV